MGYIDAHVHVWTQDAEKYPLAGNYSVEDVRPPLFLPEDILSHARPCGVERVVLVQMSYYGFDNRYMLDVMRDYDGVFSGIAVVDVEAERPDDEMRRLSKEGVRGFRVQPRGDMGRWLDGTGYERVFQCAADENLAICPLINTDALAALGPMCERFAATPVIVDHLCRIGAGQPIVDKDIDALCALAQYPQVMVKVSAFYALGAKKPPYTDLDPLIRRVYEAFGAERLMWASDCPYQVQDEHSYAASVDLVEKRLDFLSEQEREQLLGGTAAAFFFNR
jgi:predicted TIM-barrel fold metal-dependent hydrolase